MDDLSRIKAIAKLAEPSVAPSDAYISGFCKTAEAYGVDPCELIKVAWTWGGVLSDIATAPINAVVGAGNSLWSGFTGDGFAKGWRNGYEGADAVQRGIASTVFDGDTWSTAGKNLSTGAAAMLTGIGQGLAATPGIIGGAVGAVGSGLTGNGFGNGWDKGRDFVDSIGVGDYNLGTLKSNLADFQRFNKDVYVDNNNIDLNNAGTLERMGLYGIDTAAAAGRMIGETAGFAGAGKILSGAGKAVTNVAGKVVPRASGAAGAAGTAASTAGSAAGAAGTAAGTAGTAASTAGAAAGRMASTVNKVKDVAQNVGNSGAGQFVKKWGGRALKGGIGVAAPIADGVTSTENYINSTQNFMNTPAGGYSAPKDVDISTIL